MSYATQIRKIAPAYDPRHVEAIMRAEHGTLDHFSAEEFAAEVTVAVLAIEIGGEQLAEAVARTYGL